MFTLYPDGYYRVPEWSRYPWLDHGFGTVAQRALDGSLATVSQIHSADVVIASHPGLQGPGDALICSTAGLKVGVKTADCFPILLLDPVHRVVAAVHAGWRGSAMKIVQRALSAMSDRMGTVLSDVEGAIGPGIGECCFEVGAEVAREFGWYPSGSKAHLDLVKINRDQLREVKAVHAAGLCTMCGKGFWSWRRDKEDAGRMISYIGQAATGGLTR